MSQWINTKCTVAHMGSSLARRLVIAHCAGTSSSMANRVSELGFEGHVSRPAYEKESCLGGQAGCAGWGSGRGYIRIDVYRCVVSQWINGA